MKKNFFNLVSDNKNKKVAKRIILLLILLGTFIWIYPDEDTSVVFIEPTGEISSGILVTPTPEPTAPATAELKKPVNNQFTGNVEETYTPLQGSTLSDDGVTIERNEVVGTEEFQQSHEGEVAVNSSDQEIGWVEDSSLPKQEVTEIKLPESLPQSTPSPSPTPSPVVGETTESSEPAENSVEKQEEQSVPQSSAPVVEETQEETQQELPPENIQNAEPDSSVTIDTETGEVSGEEAVPQGKEDLCGPAYGYEEGKFFFDGQGCVFKG